jgi:hypothetical protein
MEDLPIVFTESLWRPMMLIAKTDQPTKFHLHPHMVYSLDHILPGTEVVCDRGLIWLTRAGDHKDHLLLPGERFAINQGGKIVIEAMREAWLRICSKENAN